MTIELNKRKRNPNNRFKIHLMGYFVVLMPFLVDRFIVDLSELGNPVYFIFLWLAFELFYFFTYLFERITLINDEERSIFWFLRKYMYIMLNLSLIFGIVYWTIFKNIPNSLEDNTVVGQNTIEQIFNFFYYSLGSFLAFDSNIVPVGILFKVVHALQAISVFLMLVFVLSNFADIKKAYSKVFDNSKED